MSKKLTNDQLRNEIKAHYDKQGKRVLGLSKMNKAGLMEIYNKIEKDKKESKKEFYRANKPLIDRLEGKKRAFEHLKKMTRKGPFGDDYAPLYYNPSDERDFTNEVKQTLSMEENRDKIKKEIIDVFKKYEIYVNPNDVRFRDGIEKYSEVSILLRTAKTSAKALATEIVVEKNKEKKAYKENASAVEEKYSNEISYYTDEMTSLKFKNFLNEK